MDTEQTEFRIPECNMEELEKRIAKLAKRAEKLGLVPPSLLNLGHEDVSLVAQGSQVLEKKQPLLTDKIVGYRRYFKMKLQGEAPVIPGWKLIAVIEHTNDSEIGNVVRTVPEMQCPPVYRHATSACDHCGTIRNRLETFVLRDKEGTYKQIGRNCLADYCRDPEAAASLCAYSEIMASALGFCGGSEDEEFFGNGGRTVDRASTEAVLAMTSRIIRHCGWLSKTKAYRQGEGVTPTANIVSAVFFDRNFFKKTDRQSRETTALQEAARDVQEKDVELATAALTWIRGLRGEAEELSDYLHNCLVIASEETVKSKHFGVACSILSSYLRHLEKDQERQIEKSRKVASQHFGEIGERGRWQAVVLGYKAFENAYGPSYLYRLLIDGTNSAVWWSSKEPQIEIGEEVIVVGTVKSHDDYRETRQTTLSRCDLFQKKDWGVCPNCQKIVITADLKKNCPNCKKRGLKVDSSWFSGEEK